MRLRQRLCLSGVMLLFMMPVWAEPGYVVRETDLMEEPYRDATVVSVLEEGTALEILERKGGWFNVESDGRKGWVRMTGVRKGEAVATESGAEVAGVLDLASGRAGTGNVVAATGVRGLNEEELREAKFNEAEIKRMESNAATTEQAQEFARQGKLTARQVEFLPNVAE